MSVQSSAARPKAHSKPSFNYRRPSLTFVVLRWLVKLLLRLIFRVEVRGLENLPHEGGYIMASNHLSWLDPFLMLTSAPAKPRIYFVAARENMETNPVRRFVTERIGGVIAVDRNKGTAHVEMESKVAEMLQAGGVLGIYPEGTVSVVETGQLLPFKKGVGHFAAHSGVPIVPIALSGTKDLYLRRRVVMIVGQPIQPNLQPETNQAEVLTSQTAAAIQAMLPTPEVGRGPKLLRNFLTNLF